MKLKLLILLLVICSISNFNTLKSAVIDNSKFYLSRSVAKENFLDLPQVLDIADLKLYKAIDEAQLNNKIDLANELIKQLKNNILVGYLLFLRYQNPKYATTTKELETWLTKYKNLPVAPIIYNMAKQKSKNRNQINKLAKPNAFNFYAITIPFTSTHPIFAEKTPSIELFTQPIKPVIMQNSITKEIQKAFKAGNNLKAQQIIESSKAKKQLNQATYDNQLSTLAKAFFLDGEDDKAIFFAKKVLENSKDLYPEASFTIALSYYRKGEFEKAMTYLFYLATNKSIFTTDIVSKSAYWYAKSALASGNLNKYIEGLKIAKDYIYNFYGILANEELSISPDYNFEIINFEKNSVNKILNTPVGKRVFALLQLGLLDWAEQELIALAQNIINDNVIDQDMLEALLYIAQLTNMPALSYKLAGNQGVYLGLSHLSYPVLIVNIEEYTIDPALLLAFMRRESNFFSGANSGPGARGLMQIMPQTANLIVHNNSNLSVAQNYTQNSLYSPKVSVTLGQKYIQTLIENPEIDGNLVYTTMGYNAGFYRAKNWIKDEHRMINDPLFFIESIPYYETRAYVKSVINDYWVYQNKLGFTPYSLKLLARGFYPFYYPPSNDDIENAKNFSYLKYSKKL